MQSGFLMPLNIIFQPNLNSALHQGLAYHATASSTSKLQSIISSCSYAGVKDEDEDVDQLDEDGVLVSTPPKAGKKGKYQQAYATMLMKQQSNPSSSPYPSSSKASGSSGRPCQNSIHWMPSTILCSSSRDSDSTSRVSKGSIRWKSPISDVRFIANAENEPDPAGLSDPGRDLTVAAAQFHPSQLTAGAQTPSSRSHPNATACPISHDCVNTKRPADEVIDKAPPGLELSLLVTLRHVLAEHRELHGRDGAHDKNVRCAGDARSSALFPGRISVSTTVELVERGSASGAQSPQPESHCRDHPSDTYCSPRPSPNAHSHTSVPGSVRVATPVAEPVERLEASPHPISSTRNGPEVHTPTEPPSAELFGPEASDVVLSPQCPENDHNDERASRRLEEPGDRSVLTPLPVLVQGASHAHTKTAADGPRATENRKRKKRHDGIARPSLARKKFRLDLNEAVLLRWASEIRHLYHDLPRQERASREMTAMAQRLRMLLAWVTCEKDRIPFDWIEKSRVARTIRYIARNDQFEMPARDLAREIIRCWKGRFAKEVLSTVDEF